MKKLILLIVISLLATTVLSAQNKEKRSDLGKRNIFSVSAGVWGKDFPPMQAFTYHKFGPTVGLDYERVMSHYIRIKGRFFGGGIYDKSTRFITRNLGLGAGVTVVPFGKRFKNLQLSAGGDYIYEISIYDYPNSGQAHTRSIGALDLAIKFNVVDNDRWTLGLSYNFICQLGKGSGIHYYTSTPLINFGLKF